MISDKFLNPGLQLASAHHQQKMMLVMDISTQDVIVIKSFTCPKIFWQAIDETPYDDGLARELTQLAGSRQNSLA